MIYKRNEVSSNNTNEVMRIRAFNRNSLLRRIATIIATIIFCPFSYSAVLQIGEPVLGGTFWGAECQQAGGANECRVGAADGEIKWLVSGGGPNCVYTRTSTPNAFQIIEGGCLSQEAAASAALAYNYPDRSGYCRVELEGMDPSYEEPSASGSVYSYQRGAYKYLYQPKNPDQTCGPGEAGTSHVAFSIVGQLSVVCPPGWEAKGTGPGYCTRPPVDCCIRLGNPIDGGTGAKLQSETDLNESEVWRLGFTRHYNSQGFTFPSSTLSGPGLQERKTALGPVWRHSYQRRIVTTTYANVKTAFVIRDDGRVIPFRLDANGFWKPPLYRTERLLPVMSGATIIGWRLTNAQLQIESFDGLGRLTSIQDVSGKRQTVIYSDGTATGPAGATIYLQTTPLPPGYLLRVEDEAGRFIKFDYQPGGLLAALTTSAGTTVVYGVDGRGLLRSVTYADSRSRTYVYRVDEGLPAVPGGADLLSGVVDENGVRYSTFKYDTYGRATSTEHAGVVDLYTVTYPWTTVMLASANISVVNPIGTSSTFSILKVGGIFRQSGATRPAGAGSPASVSTNAYDSYGNLTRRDDFNANRTCFSYDATRGLETGRIEGLANTADCAFLLTPGEVLPAGSRRISSVWHPDVPLRAQLAEPLKITTSIFQGRPDPFNGGVLASCSSGAGTLPDGKPIAVLCKEVEQATTDVDGNLGFAAVLQSGVPNRVRQWTYDQYGKVLTAKDALNRVTTYAYYVDTVFTGVDPVAVGHTTGDLQTITNAAGKVTTFAKYNKLSQLLESQDPNGVLTVNAYDLRQRLTSVSVGGQATSFQYDFAGQLLKTIAPDGSWIGYEYDAAHRKTAVKDNLGNRVEYVLDNLGNQTTENVKDSGGNLRRQLARSIDPLGRVQQATGRE